MNQRSKNILAAIGALFGYKCTSRITNIGSPNDIIKTKHTTYIKTDEWVDEDGKNMYRWLIYSNKKKNPELN